MAVPTIIDDEALGRLTWDGKSGEWQFTIVLPDGRTIPGSIMPEDSRRPLQDQGFPEMRERILRVRDNEPSIRGDVASRMFDWWLEAYYDEEIDEVDTLEGFRDAISLCGISVYEDRKVRLIYQDGGLVGGHGISVRLSETGEIDMGPDIFG